MNKKRKLSVTLDKELVSNIDSKRSKIGLGRSSYINMELRRVMKKRLENG